MDKYVASIPLRGVIPFCTRSCAAVTFFFFPPAACPSAFSASFCSFFYSQNMSAQSPRLQTVSQLGSRTMDHIFNIFAKRGTPQLGLGGAGSVRFRGCWRSLRSRREGSVAVVSVKPPVVSAREDRRFWSRRQCPAGCLLGWGVGGANRTPASLPGKITWAR